MVDHTENMILFYEFWRWQYTKRNSRIVSAINTVEEKSKTLCSLGLVDDPGYAVFALKRLQPDYVGRNIPSLVRVLRRPTEKEIQILNEIDSLYSIVQKEGYSSDDILGSMPDSTEIINNVANKGTITNLVPDDIRRNDSSCVSCVGKMTTDNEIKHSTLCNKDGASVYVFYVDINAPDESIASDIIRDVRFYRCHDAGKFKPGWSCPEMCAQYESCSSRSISLTLSGLRATYLARSGVAFNPDKPAPRAVGLWLWDYAQKHREDRKEGTVAAAIRALKKQLGPEINALGFAASEENVFRRFYRKTAECIDACEVLPFK